MDRLIWRPFPGWPDFPHMSLPPPAARHPWSVYLDHDLLPPCNLPAAASDLHHGIIPCRVFAGA